MIACTHRVGAGSTRDRRFSFLKDPHRRALWITAVQQKDLEPKTKKNTVVSVAVIFFWESHSHTSPILTSRRAWCMHLQRQTLAASLAWHLGLFKLSVGQYSNENHCLGIALPHLSLNLYSKQVDFPNWPVHLRTLHGQQSQTSTWMWGRYRYFLLLKEVAALPVQPDRTGRGPPEHRQGKADWPIDDWVRRNFEFCLFVDVSFSSKSNHRARAAHRVLKADVFRESKKSVWFPSSEIDDRSWPLSVIVRVLRGRIRFGIGNT